MNGWWVLVCMAALLVVGGWLWHAANKTWDAIERRREAKRNAILLAKNRHPSSRSRMESGMDFMLWDKETKREIER